MILERERERERERKRERDLKRPFLDIFAHLKQFCDERKSDSCEKLRLWKCKQKCCSKRENGIFVNAYIPFLIFKSYSSNPDMIVGRMIVF